MPLILNTAKFRSHVVTVDGIEGVTFTVRALDVNDHMAMTYIMAEVARVGAEHLLSLPKAVRIELVDLLAVGVTDWSGVKDEYGREIAFEPELLRKHLDPQTMYRLFFAIAKSLRPTEDERKNLSTAPKSESSAPATSTASDAGSSAPIPAASPAS